jgi:hypothetical protein
MSGPVVVPAPFACRSANAISLFNDFDFFNRHASLAEFKLSRVSFAFSLGALVINFTADTVILLFRPKAGRESAMAEPKGGGYVLSMKTHSNIIGHIPIDDATLLKVVKALDIQARAPHVKAETHVSDIETIHIFRGP